MFAKFHYPVFLSALFFLACHSAKKEEISNYPVDSFFLHELNKIDSLPIAIFHIKIENGISDTSIIEKQKFREIVEGLFLKEVSGFSVKTEYSESILEDTQLDDITITYSNDHIDKGLEKIELHVQKSSTALRSVYMERNDPSAGLNRIRKMLWISGKSLLITSLAYKANDEIENRTDKFTWN